MKFHPNYPNDNNKGQRHIWHALKNAFESDEGVAYYRYPIFATTGRGRSEPDFLMIHRRYGIWIFESKGCYIGNIRAIEGHDWQMLDWYSESMSPVSQVEAQLFEVKALVERDPELRKLRIHFDYRVVLPFVTSAEWKAQGYQNHPSTNGVVWLEDHIEMPCFKHEVHEASAKYMVSLSDEMWERLKGVFRGVVSDEAPRQPISNSSPTNYSRIIHAVESRLRVLDEKQDRISQEVPEGPQRLRGLAGSGKTVLFARRIAQMHASHPEWDLAFVYWSRSLNQQIRNLVEKSYRRLTGELPNWEKLHVWHAWGSRELTGFYKELASKWDCRFLNFTQAKEAAIEGESPYGAACRLFEEESRDRQPVFDAIIVDEGQDLPAAFYRVAYRSLRDPKRLYWAYDEAQGVDSLIVPSAAEIFGQDATGRPMVDLSGSYSSGMQKAHNMNRCYRTPRLILTAAHAINMGLLREGGPIQGVTSKDDWTALGYKVVEGDFSPMSVKAGTTVILERTDLTSGHPIDRPDFEPAIDYSNVLTVRATESEAEDVNIVIGGIQRDLESGLRPEDIAVVCLDPVSSLLKKVADQLQVLGIKVLSLNDENKDQFREEGCVTLSSIRRAKGNDAYKVYALNLHMADSSQIKDFEKEMVARNQIFVALTRAKMWCVAVGRNGAVMQELSTAVNQRGTLRFPAFNQASLKRSMVDQDAQQLEMY
jgi:superfamily I DNA and RNA helicase